MYYKHCLAALRCQTSFKYCSVEQRVMPDSAEQTNPYRLYPFNNSHAAAGVIIIRATCEILFRTVVL